MAKWQEGGGKVQASHTQESNYPFHIQRRVISATWLLHVDILKMSLATFKSSLDKRLRKNTVCFAFNSKSTQLFDEHGH